MSRLDMITIAIVVVCLAALGYLVYKIAGLYNSEEPTTPITEAYGNEETPDEQTYTDWDDEVAATGDDTAEGGACSSLLINMDGPRIVLAIICHHFIRIDIGEH